MSRYELAGRTVVITGSTGGLGSALADALHHRGAHLALLGRDKTALAAQADMLGRPRTAWAAQADVTDLVSVRSAIDRAADHFGRIDIVVANAGVNVIAPTATFDPDAFERVINVNLTGVWRTFKAAPPARRTSTRLFAGHRLNGGLRTLPAPRPLHRQQGRRLGDEQQHPPRACCESAGHSHSLMAATSTVAS